MKMLKIFMNEFLFISLVNTEKDFCHLVDAESDFFMEEEDLFLLFILGFIYLGYSIMSQTLSGVDSWVNNLFH